jgi:periplasmic protein TonB
MRLAALTILATAVVLQPQSIKPKTKPPVVIRKAMPKYTDEARKAKVEGAVFLQALIGTDGKAHNILVIRSLGYGLDEKAVECLSQWRFRPGTRDGVPVSSSQRAEIVFHLASK